MKVKLLSRVQLFATPWTAAYQAPPSMVFSRQEYWRGVPSPSLAMQETLVQFLGLEDLLEKGKATDSSILGLPGGLAVKESACNVGDLGSISGLGRSPGEGEGYPLHYSGLGRRVGHD